MEKTKNRKGSISESLRNLFENIRSSVVVSILGDEELNDSENVNEINSEEDIQRIMNTSNQLGNATISKEDNEISKILMEGIKEVGNIENETISEKSYKKTTNKAQPVYKSNNIQARDYRVPPKQINKNGDIQINNREIDK